jgi:hypothetical protein
MDMAEPCVVCGTDRTENIDGTPSVLCLGHRLLYDEYLADRRERTGDDNQMFGNLVTWAAPSA